MADHDNIKDELNSLNSGLPHSDSQKSPFSVPDGYFDGLAASILAKVKGQTSSPATELQELSPFLAGLSKEMPYAVPAGYFDENIATLPFLLKEEESALLTSIGKTMPYTVPQGYFENLAGRMLEKVEAPKAKVVPLFARRWMRAAAAAVVGGVILLGGYRLLNAPEGDEVTASTFQQADTTSKLVAQNQKTSVVQDIKKASTEELDAFIKSVPLNSTAVQTETPAPGEKGEVKELLKDVSVKEIDTFLEQLPNADEDVATID